MPDAGSRPVSYPRGQCTRAVRHKGCLWVFSAAAGGCSFSARHWCAVDIETAPAVPGRPGPFADCREHRGVATAPRHAMPTSESRARLLRPPVTGESGLCRAPTTLDTCPLLPLEAYGSSHNNPMMLLHFPT